MYPDMSGRLNDELATFRRPGGNPNGQTLDRQGRLLTCEHSGRRVVRTGIDGMVKVLAEYYQGKRLNSLNDIIVRSDGSVYFTDPTFGLGMPPLGCKWQRFRFRSERRTMLSGTAGLPG